MLRGMLKSLVRPSPFKAGVAVTLLAAALYIVGGMDVENELGLLRELRALDNRVFDIMFRARGPSPTTGSVVIVDIDEKSLARMGQWPWPRDVIAGLIRRIDAYAPRAVGLDIFFAEEDRASPRRSIRELSRRLGREVVAAVRPEELDKLDNDKELGRAIAEAGKVVLGYSFQMEPDGLKEEGARPFPMCEIRMEPPGAKAPLLAAYRPILNIPAICESPASEGFINADPDASGTVRRVPLFVDLDGQPYPALALEVLRVGLGETGFAILVPDQRRGVLGIRIGDRIARTDEMCRICVNFRGPVGTFPYVSAADVLDGKAPREALEGKFVFVGTSASGLHDLRATPFSRAAPGVDVHANIIDNVLMQDPMCLDPVKERMVVSTMIIAGGAALSALLAWVGPVIGGSVGALFICMVTAGNYYVFFKNNQLIAVTYPLLAVMAIFSVVTLANYFLEGRKRRFIRGAFGLYVSDEVVDQLVKDPGSLGLSGIEKVLTVMFADIRGFTTMSEKMSAHEVSAFLNEYFTAMTEVIMAHRGTVDKFMGDAVMAMWGAPLDDPRHAANAVRCALGMTRRLEAMRREWSARGLPHLEIGIGLNTGVMRVGNMGSRSRFEYSVIGDNVNLASRLEGLNKAYGTSIVLSEYTRRAVGEEFLCREIDLVRVKGRTKPVRIYEPVAAGPGGEDERAGIRAFEEALSAYRGRDFDRAGAAMRALYEKEAKPLYALYLERIEEFRVSPPAAEWDGSSAFDTK